MTLSLMEKEARQAPQAVDRFLSTNAAALTELAGLLRARQPSVIVTAARGSSDHAATYFKYLIEILTGIPCASIGASVASVWKTELHLRNAVCITISQSGQSPDILALQDTARRAGALTVALVNQSGSPAEQACDIFLSLAAGAEKSVAATKSFIVSLAAAAAITSLWKQDEALITALRDLPEKLELAADLQWPDFQARVASAQSLYVLGRGPSLAIAQETALKLKETCAVHAEALSFAEVMHGPLELVTPDFPVLAFSPDDASRHLAKQSLARLHYLGAALFTVEDGGLDYIPTGHALLEPISMIQTAYLNIAPIARARGRDPDHPHLLSKVTETL